MKLYRATVQFDMILFAETEAEAEEVVIQYARDEVENLTGLGEICPHGLTEIKKLSETGKSFWDSIPWSIHGEIRTVRQILGEKP